MHDPARKPQLFTPPARRQATIEASATASGGPVERLLSGFSLARGRHNLTAEDVLVFLAIGQLGIVKSGAILTLRPIAYAEVSALLQIPKETIRRKATRLIEMDMIYLTSRGVIVKNVEEWSSLAASMLHIE